jgi:Na+/H+-translocating membrane pyrophosphatase
VLRWDVSLLRPSVLVSAGVGVVLALAYAASAAQAGIRGARDVSLEIERQFRAFSREPGLAGVPHDFSPSYKACIELSARSAFLRLGPVVASALALPALLALLVHALGSTGQAALATEGLVTSVVCTGLVGFFAAFALDLARVTCEKAVRSGRAGNVGDEDSVSTPANIGNQLGRAAGPAARVLVVATAAVALALAPFLK